MAHDVFLSHSSKDKAAADAACNILERNGIRVWMAPRDIMPGMGWAKSIIGGIAGAKVMVLMFSSHANTSPQVEREVERAINKSIPIVPFRVENVQPNEALEYFISSPHWLDAFTPPVEQHFERLVLAVKHLLASGYVKAREDAAPEPDDAQPHDDAAFFVDIEPERSEASDAERRAIQEESVLVAQAATLRTQPPAEEKEAANAVEAGAGTANSVITGEAQPAAPPPLTSARVKTVTPPSGDAREAKAREPPKAAEKPDPADQPRPGVLPADGTSESRPPDRADARPTEQRASRLRDAPGEHPAEEPASHHAATTAAPEAGDKQVPPIPHPVPEEVPAGDGGRPSRRLVVIGGLGLAGAAATALVIRHAGEAPGIRTPPASAPNPAAETPRVRTLTGHSNSVSSVAYSPDGRTLASGSNDHTIRLWDVASGAPQRTLTGHAGNVYSVAFSPNGRVLASVSEDRTIKLWQASSGALQRTIPGLADTSETVAFSPDGRTIASGSSDNRIKVWDVASGVLHRAFKGHAGMVVCVAFSPDGRTLASGSEDKTVKLWDTASGALQRTLTGNAEDVFSIAFSPDGRTLASGDYDHTIRLWDAGSATLQRVLTGHTESVESLAFSPDGRTLASGSGDKTIRLWDPASGALQQALTGHTDIVYSVAFSPDGRTLASGSADDSIKLWELG